MSDPGPQDPVTALASATAQTHELHVSLIESGFTPVEALDLIKEVMRAGMLAKPCPHCGRQPV